MLTFIDHAGIAGHQYRLYAQAHSTTKNSKGISDEGNVLA